MEKVVISEGFAEMDFERVTAMLAEAHWCKGIGRAEVEKAARNSALVVGAFLSGAQVGYARVISDKTRFAYFMDVIVADSHRQRGIGQSMVNYIRAHDAFLDVYQWMLYTTYAHGMYGKLGFKPLSAPGNLLEIKSPRPDR